MIKNYHGESAKAGRASVARITLKALRMVRDESPEEWDALIKSEGGTYIMDLWDYLKKMESFGLVEMIEE